MVFLYKIFWVFFFGIMNKTFSFLKVSKQKTHCNWSHLLPTLTIFLSLLHVDVWQVKQFQRKLLPVSYKKVLTYLANFTVVAFRGTKPVWNWIWNIFIEAICWKQETGNCINPHEQYVQYSAFNVMQSIISIKVFWGICFATKISI